MLQMVNYSNSQPPTSAHHIQLLEIAVGNVMAAPIRHRIKLQAMGELHVGFLEEPLKLLPPKSIPLFLALFFLLLARIRYARSWEQIKFKVFVSERRGVAAEGVQTCGKRSRSSEAEETAVGRLLLWCGSGRLS